jgi:hypothetical protein
MMNKKNTIGEIMSPINQVSVFQPKSMVPSDHEMMVFQTMAKQAVGSKLYRGIGDEFAVMTIMLAARELDIPPMAALNGGINIINGKTEISARMMSALIMRRGHTIRVVSSDAEKCVLLGIRSDNNEQLTETFTIDEARQAGLIKEGGGWKKWPKDMLYARCMSRLARRLFPDVIGMGYVEGEIYETIKKPMENVDAEMASVEMVPAAEEQELLKTFLSQFDKDEAMGWANYIAQLKEKAGVPLRMIVDKYNEDPAKATEKFQAWLDKLKKAS